ncbi:MAG: class I tRNA ligase family protein [Candidatus Wallbacteria bacterium]|nr:class I tRNA ligase family protein [Candidatus Wallbacteria bacterium]
MARAEGKPDVDRRRRELAARVRAWSLEEFRRMLEDAGVTRAFVTYENGEFSVSHPALLEPVRAFLELSGDFARHEAVFIGREHGLASVFFAFVHDTRRGLAQGGLRFKPYPNVAELLVDGLRLAQGMTRKNALAGLWWGGGKGILSWPADCASPDELPPGSARRAEIFRAYGRFIASLGGVYYTAEDIGTKTADMDAILSENRFITCISRSRGGSGNPSPYTARGVFRGMQAAWLFLTGTDRLQGVRVAVQGAGNVGAPLVELLDDAGASVWVGDVNQRAVAELIARRPRVQAVGGADLFALDVDVVAPCAIGAVINSETIPRLKARLICGAANNILRAPEDAERLRERGIAFVPDYVCNRMGIVNCADEWHGYLDEDIQFAAERVYPDTLRVLRHARELGITTREAADKLADVAAAELHPLLGHRGRRIIDHLIDSGWHTPGERKVRRRAPPAFVPALDEPELRVAWQRDARFAGAGHSVAASPVSAACRPSLATFFSPVLLDVRARALEWLSGKNPRRILGSEHGGLELQLSVERSLPHERLEIGRPKFVELCRDFHGRNDAAIREQLHQLGVGFDPVTWLDPMSPQGRDAVRRLYFALADAKLIAQDNPLTYRCPRCRTVCVALDIVRREVEVTERYAIRVTTDAGAAIETMEFFPELLLGAVAVAVNPRGRYRELAGQAVRIPVRQGALPVVTVEALATDAEFLVPAWRHLDAAAAAAHGILDCPELFDERGEIRAAEGRAASSRDSARKAVLASLAGGAVCETGRWSVEARRCRRCETVVLPDRSAQSYVRFETAAGHLERAIESGAVTLEPARWKERVLEHLRGLEPWCISRQYWWGNDNPERPQERLSTWFSMAALALEAAGWPSTATPAPIDEVFVDPDFLVRWVVPAQLASFAVTGRPLFRTIHVHGSIHVVEGSLSVDAPRESGDRPDEQRLVRRVYPRPMRNGRGNVVEPSTLIRRFGADALRLGYLLCLDVDGGRVVTLSEGRLRGARRAVQSFAGKVAGLFRLFQPPMVAGAAHLSDHWIVARARAAREAARDAYERHSLREVADIFLDVTDDFSLYAGLAAARRREGTDLGAVRAATVRVLEELGPAFGPLCPYVFEKLAAWTRERRPASDFDVSADVWQHALVVELRRAPAAGSKLATSDPAVAALLAAGLAELARITGRPVELAQGPIAGATVTVGPVVVLRSGAREGSLRTGVSGRHGVESASAVGG